MRPSIYSGDAIKRVSIIASDNVRIVFSSVLRGGPLLILCTSLLWIVSPSIIGSMRGKLGILQDSMIIKAVDATPSLPKKSKRKHTNTSSNTLKI
jgi:hypothetical protein